MRHEARVVLHDAITAAARITEVMSNITEEEFVEDWKLRAIVERQYMVIGEALGRLRKDHVVLARGIHFVDELIDFRNVLAHAYDRVDPRLVFALTHSRLHELQKNLQAALDGL